MAEVVVEEDEIAGSHGVQRHRRAGARLSDAGAGRETPATFQAAWVRPELSYDPGPAAPQTHGLPIWERAKASTWMTFES